MNLVFDVGNTKTAMGCWDGADLRGQWRLVRQERATARSLAARVRDLLEEAGISRDEVRQVTLASVVPAQIRLIREVAELEFGASFLTVDATIPLPIQLAVDQPVRLGADRIVTAIAAHLCFRTNTVVVDLGTATTFGCITADGVFLGGAIAPGAATAARSLVEQTAQLPDVALGPPAAVIGRVTEAALQSGIFFGGVDAVDGMVRRIRSEWRPDVRVIATGGLAPLVAPHCETVEQIEPLLALRGLNLAREYQSHAVL